MSLILPPRFLFRLAYRIPWIAEMPNTDDEGPLLELPASARIDAFTTMESPEKPFAELRLAWNESGLGLQLEVRGKNQEPFADPDRPRQSDGLHLWLDTRDARANHRASRFCHQFHFLPTGGGPERDEPMFVQSKIPRAMQDAPMVLAHEVPLRVERIRSGYRIEAFLPGSALHGFDPEQHSRWGFFYAVTDHELGEQLLSAARELPYWEDPSLWQVLELAQPSTQPQAKE